MLSMSAGRISDRFLRRDYTPPKPRIYLVRHSLAICVTTGLSWLCRTSGTDRLLVHLFPATSWPYHPPMRDEPAPQSSDEALTPASVLRELLDCTELNLDDLEEHTRAVITKARAVLEQRTCF
jgi:hypothetical protein